MKKLIQLIAILSFSLSSKIALAASSSYVCENESKTLYTKSADANIEGDFELKYKRSGKDVTYSGEATVVGNPKYYIGKAPIMAWPVGSSQVLEENCEVMHIIQADGTECYGRQFWNIVTRRTYIIKGENNTSLFTDAILGKDADVDGKTQSGYIVQTLTCTDSGVTTAGGCFVEADSRLVETVSEPCQK